MLHPFPLSRPSLFTRYGAALAALLLAAITFPAQAQLSSQEQEIVSLLSGTSGQQRPFIHVDPILSRVARARAMDMANRHYFAHVNPDGLGANYLVRAAGYALPDGYDTSPSANNIESIEAGDDSAQAAWDTFMGSPPHKLHLLGQNSFYAAQTSVGVGYYEDPNSDYQFYWVVITAPPPGPSLAISSPSANAGLSSGQTSITGSTGGTPPAARVVWRLENAAGIGNFADATGTSSWSASVTDLVPGPNTVRVRSLSVGGATLMEATRTFRYVVLTPLTIALEGNGTVTSGFLGTTQREMGEPYTIAATAGTGWLFDHWSGSDSVTTRSLHFTMADGYAATAHFRVNPFYPLKGNYNGLIQTQPATAATSGWLKLTTTLAGGFSGRLTLAGLSWAVSGIFDANGDAQVTVHPAKAAPLTLALHLDLTSVPGVITGTVSNGTFTAGLSADQALTPTQKHFAAGRYTVALQADPENQAATVPQGDGFAVLLVTPAGVASLTGTLADGHAFAQSATVSAGGLLPIYVSLPGGAATIAGTATFSQVDGSLDGSLLWTKAARPLDHYFPAGFSTQLGVAGARYVAPKPGTPVLSVPALAGNSALQLTAGDLTGVLDQLLTLSPNNKVTPVDQTVPKVAVSITASTGRYSGSFIHPITKALTHFNGVVLQTRNAGSGFFLGQTESGPASLMAAP